ncbi:U32 family peptidase [Novipirellula artificiosorum]|uniref:Putative protease YhbU n=1 Tax=Novipirellula artificiosorum TaxID=2528016 RepID=A0A5C6DIR7_9BACT|nr:U32 family peptidase [Novipirellula artificiosorum]TWU35984.1 putative protease YhbU precursor [Novipirellula artificiosorum]
MNPTPRLPASRSIELLAPAGDWECARAAVENGADAIYFGLDCGFNARVRAKNFGLPDLPDLMSWLRTRGVRGYVTMNTLAFPSELPPLIGVIESVAASGVDAVLIQDFGVARIVHAICPELEIHASTQMSLSSAETIEVASDLGLSRVVLARELSIAEIRKITAATHMPVECFIHGALCVAYSGQCLTSESLGGRSANRGHCAQACRLPYELVVDGEDRDLGEVRYLLSPQDLAGYAAIPDMIDAGVASLKIEGRLKTAEYVANITGHYRTAIDDAIQTGAVHVDDVARREMELSFSRGFSPGWIEGNDHKRLVPGDHSAKRGIRLGAILDCKSDRILVHVDAPVTLGDGLAIEVQQGEFQGGRIYSLETGRGQRFDSVEADTDVWIGFGRGEIEWQRVQRGDLVFKNDDPKLNRRLRQSFAGEDPQSRQPIDMVIGAEAGKTLQLSATTSGGITVSVSGDQVLEKANKHPANAARLREKMERLGGTSFELRSLKATITGEPMVPASLLNQLRRTLTDALTLRLRQPPVRTIDAEAGRVLLAPLPRSVDEVITPSKPQLVVLCRTLEQIEAVASSDVDWIYTDLHDVRHYRDAVQIAHQHHAKIGIANVRIQKPGEMGLLRVLRRLDADCFLVRNLAAVGYLKTLGKPLVADFSLNTANHRSAEWLMDLGVQRVTASYDLNRDQLMDLVDSARPTDLEIVIHQHMPMFHMEHCVFCSVLSPGTNKTNCGRPCDRHVVTLRDRVGAEHPLQADVACRNTLYNATAQSGSEIVADLIRKGIRWFRVELLEQNAKESQQTIATYRQLLAGELSGSEVWRRLQATNRLGVTRGTLESKRNPLAIL